MKAQMRRQKRLLSAQDILKGLDRIADTVITGTQDRSGVKSLQFAADYGTGAFPEFLKDLTGKAGGAVPAGFSSGSDHCTDQSPAGPLAAAHSAAESGSGNKQLRIIADGSDDRLAAVADVSPPQFHGLFDRWKSGESFVSSVIHSDFSFRSRIVLKSRTLSEKLFPFFDDAAVIEVIDAHGLADAGQCAIGLFDSFGRSGFQNVVNRINIRFPFGTFGTDRAEF